MYLPCEHPCAYPNRFYATVDGRVIVSRSAQPLLDDCSGCLIVARR